MTMIEITIADVKNITGSSAPLAAEMVPIINQWSDHFNVTTFARMAGYLGQLSVESLFKYRGEIWGPTKAQLSYEGRVKGLGNTKRGDGSKYRGYGGIQVTGRANVTEFYNWAKKELGALIDVPNFVENPALLGTAPWWVLASFWYWKTRNLNALCDGLTVSNAQDTKLPDGKVKPTSRVRPITKKVNGGYNHLPERITATVRALKRLSPALTAERNPTRLMSDEQAVSVSQGVVVGGKVSPVSGSIPSLGAIMDGLGKPNLIQTGKTKAALPAGDTSGGRRKLPQPETITKDGLKTIQRILFDKGYKSVGKDDGIYGVDTRDAVIGFRRDHALPLAADLDGNGALDGDELMDAEFQRALLSSGGREVDETRAELPSLDIAKLVPEVMAGKISKNISLGGLTLGGVPAVAGIAGKVFGGFKDWRDTVQPWFDSISFEVPTWGWLVMLTGLSLGSYIYARKAEKKAVEAYRSGERVAQSG